MVNIKKYCMIFSLNKNEVIPPKQIKGPKGRVFSFSLFQKSFDIKQDQSSRYKNRSKMN